MKGLLVSSVLNKLNEKKIEHTLEKSIYTALNQTTIRNKRTTQGLGLRNDIIEKLFEIIKLSFL